MTANVAVDHVLVAVRDLDDAVRRWRAAGLDAHVGGHHPAGTHNALVRGPQRAYLELIGAADDSQDATALRVRSAPGPIAWAIGVDDLASVSGLLVERGFGHLGPAGVTDGSRVTPAGEHFSWRILELAERPLDSHLPFLIQWNTPMPPAADGFQVVGLTIEVPDPDMTLDVLEVCGLARTTTPGRLTDGVVDVTVAGGERGVVAVAITGAVAGSRVLDGLRIDTSLR